MKNSSNYSKRLLVLVIALIGLGAWSSVPDHLRDLMTKGIARAALPSEITVASPVSSGHPVLHSSGHGTPWVKLSDGHEVPTAYRGPARLVRTLAQNQAQPLALASGDFDEDGVPDLVSGYAGPGASSPCTAAMLMLSDVF